MANAAGPILVVDHDEGARLFVGALLEDAGFRVAQAESGENALALASSVRNRTRL